MFKLRYQEMLKMEEFFKKKKNWFNYLLIGFIMLFVFQVTMEVLKHIHN